MTTRATRRLLCSCLLLGLALAAIAAGQYLAAGVMGAGAILAAPD